MSKRSMKNWKHWRGRAYQHKTEYNNIWIAELNKKKHEQSKERSN